MVFCGGPGLLCGFSPGGFLGEAQGEDGEFLLETGDFGGRGFEFVKQGRRCAAARAGGSGARAGGEGGCVGRCSWDGHFAGEGGVAQNLGGRVVVALGVGGDDHDGLLRRNVLCGPCRGWEGVGEEELGELALAEGYNILGMC